MIAGLKKDANSVCHKPEQVPGGVTKSRLAPQEFWSTSAEVDFEIEQRLGLIRAWQSGMERRRLTSVLQEALGTCRNEWRKRRHTYTGPELGAGAEEDAEGRRNSRPPARQLVLSRSLSETLHVFPFPADFYMDVQGSSLGVCKHRAKTGGPRAIVVFCPGVMGGVGPGRRPGAAYDEAALFPQVARKLASMPDLGVDSYQLSWPHANPECDLAVDGVFQVLRYACKDCADPPGLIFVGHSYGGAIALLAAAKVASEGMELGEASGRAGGQKGTAAQVSGLCTFNTEFHKEMCGEPLSKLRGSRALLVCGDADGIVPQCATHSLHEALPMEDKRLMVLPGGTHDLFAHREELVEELVHFVTTGCGTPFQNHILQPAGQEVA